MTEPAPKEEKMDVSKFAETFAALEKDKETLIEEVKKRGENIDKLVVFHNKTVEELKGKHAEELAKIRSAVKNALMDDHE